MKCPNLPVPTYMEAINYEPQCKRDIRKPLKTDFKYEKIFYLLGSEFKRIDYLSYWRDLKEYKKKLKLRNL